MPNPLLSFLLLSALALPLPVLTTPAPADLFPRARCNADNCLRALRNPTNAASASQYCSQAATTAIAYPTYLSQCTVGSTIASSRVSSACSCYIGASTTTTTTTTSTESTPTPTPTPTPAPCPNSTFHLQASAPFIDTYYLTLTPTLSSNLTLQPLFSLATALYLSPTTGHLVLPSTGQLAHLNPSIDPFDATAYTLAPVVFDANPRVPDAWVLTCAFNGAGQMGCRAGARGLSVLQYLVGGGLELGVSTVDTFVTLRAVCV